MHQELQAQLVKDGKGVVISNNHQYPAVNGQMLEGFEASNSSITMLLSCVAAGHLCQAHAGYHGPEHSSHCKNITDVLAAFLIAAGKYSYFGCSTGWYIDSWQHWNAEFDLPLGEPVSAAELKGDVWSRQFKSGTVVSFNITGSKGTIQWAKEPSN